MRGHTWRRGFVPDGHDSVPGWWCENCGEEIVTSDLIPPSIHELVHRWEPDVGRLRMTCEEFVAFEVMYQ